MPKPHSKSADLKGTRGVVGGKRRRHGNPTGAEATGCRDACSHFKHQIQLEVHFQDMDEEIKTHKITSRIVYPFED